MALSLNKNWLLLAGAIALGGLAFFLSNRAIQSRITELEEEATRGKTLVPVVVASRPLTAGETIDSTVVSVRSIPSEYVNKTTIVPDTYDAVDGQALQVDVQRGEPLLTTYTASRGGDVFSATLKDGRRALTIEVDEISSISGMLRPGDRIDLMLTARPPGNDKEFTFPMLSNVEVLATGRAQKSAPAAGEAAARGYSHVTLDVTPQEATRIIAAKNGGRVTAVLRAPVDKVANPSRALTIDDVVASIVPSTEGARRMVEFIIGGSSSGGGSKVSQAPVLDTAQQVQGARALAVAAAALANGTAPATAPASTRAAPVIAPAVPNGVSGVSGLPSGAVAPAAPSTPR